MVARRTARIPLGVGGVDRKSHEKHVPAGKWESAINVELRKDGAIAKRRSLGTSNALLTSRHVGTLTSPGGRFIVENSAYNSARMRFYAERDDGTTGSQKRMNGVGISDVNPVAIATGLGYDFESCQVAVYGGHVYALGVSESTAGGTYSIYLVDCTEGPSSLITTSATFVATVDAPVCRLVTMSDGVCVVWGDESANTLYGRVFVNGAWLAAATSLRTLPATALNGVNSAWDAVSSSDGGDLYVAIRESGAAAGVYGWTYAGSGSFTPLASSQSITMASIQAVSIAINATYVLAMAVTSTGAVGTVDRFPIDLSTTATSLALSSIGGSIVDCGIGFFSDGTLALAAWGSTTNARTQALTVSTMAAYGSVDIHGACVLAHKPIQDETAATPTVLYGMRLRDDDTSVVYVTMCRGTGSTDVAGPIAAYAHQIAKDDYAMPNNLSAASMVATDTGYKLYWGGVVRHNVYLETGATRVSGGKMAAVATLDLSTEHILNHASAHETVMVAGSMPTPIVAGVPVGAAYSHPPYIQSVAGVAGSGSMSLDTYNVKVVFEAVDERGRKWRSQPSAASTITLTGSENEIDIVVERPLLGSYALVNVVPYMTTAGGTSVFYRAEAFGDSSTINMFDASALTITVGPSDATLQGREVLYTDLGELEHFAPPPCRTIVSHRGRFVAIHSETGDIWFSLEFSRGEGVHWSQELVVLNPDPSDIPTALVSTNSALIVFYRDRIGFIYGDGPNNQGLGQSFSAIQFLPDADVGAVSAKALAKIPQGVIFCDPDKGFHLMPYGGGPPQYVGRDIDGVPSATIIGAAHLPDRHEVRFGFYDNDSYTVLGAAQSVSWLTYHYDRGAWSWGYAADHTAGNTHCIADGNTFIFDGAPEDAGPGYDGASTYVPTTLVTGWIVLSEATRLQGRHRLWHLYLFAESEDIHDLGVVIYYDYDVTDLSVHSQAGHTADRVKVWPAKQFLESFKIAITDGEDTGNTTTAEGFTLSDLELHYGIYPGSRPRVKPADVVA